MLSAREDIERGGPLISSSKERERADFNSISAYGSSGVGDPAIRDLEEMHGIQVKFAR